MEPVGETYILYHRTGDFCKLLKTYKLRVESLSGNNRDPQKGDLRILPAVGEEALGEILSNRVLVVYNKPPRGPHSKDLTFKGEAIKLEGLVKEFEID